MSLHIIRGRQNPAVLTNRTGGAVNEGDVVIIDTANPESFVSTAVEGQIAESIGVVLETIANGASGRVCVGGSIDRVNLDAIANVGDWIKTDGVALQATPQASPGPGCFGQVLEASATPSAVIIAYPLQPGNTLDQAYDQGGAGAGRAITADSGPVDIAQNGIDVQNIELYDTTELTINAGVITRTQGYHRVDTEGDAASDDLTTINGGTQPGQGLVIRAENAGRTVVVKHNVGNIWCLGETDILLEDVEDHLLLIFDGTKWCTLGGGQGIPIVGPTREIFLTAAGGWPSTTNGCADNTKNEYPVNGINLYSLDFDAAAIEYAEWTVWMPDKWDADTLAFKVAWTAAGGEAAQTVEWNLQGRAYNNDDAIDQAWGASVEVSDALIAADDIHYTALAGPLTIANAAPTGQKVQFRVWRDALNDTLANDARLLGVKVYYTEML